MPRYRLTHVRGPYERPEKFVDFDADNDVEATRIANDKRQMFAMELERVGGRYLGDGRLYARICSSKLG